MQTVDGLIPDTDKKCYRYESNQYDPDEVEFMLAMERYMRENRRPFLRWHEVMAVVQSLGYRKVGTIEVMDMKSPADSDEWREFSSFRLGCS
jgi:hypothetical protein